MRAFEASRASGLKLITGAEFSTRDGAFKCVLLVETMAGYTALCELSPRARRRSLKGEYRFELSDLELAPAGLLMLWLPQPLPTAELEIQGRRIAMQWNTRAWLAIEAGCDKRFATCRVKFANTANFRGFPHVPAQEWLLATPRADGTDDGVRCK